jgi:hypothetical protein
VQELTRWGMASGRFLTLPPSGRVFGAAMSSSPWEKLGNGDEDVATPFNAGAESRCAHAPGTMASTLWKGFWNGDEDIAAPVREWLKHGVPRMDEMNENFTGWILRWLEGRTSALVANRGLGQLLSGPSQGWCSANNQCGYGSRQTDPISG